MMTHEESSDDKKSAEVKSEEILKDCPNIWKERR
jgi:hypothetical protein